MSQRPLLLCQSSLSSGAYRYTYPHYEHFSLLSLETWVKNMALEKLQKNCYSLPVGCPGWMTPWEIWVSSSCCPVRLELLKGNLCCLVFSIYLLDWNGWNRYGLGHRSRWKQGQAALVTLGFFPGPCPGPGWPQDVNWTNSNSDVCRNSVNRKTPAGFGEAIRSDLNYASHNTSLLNCHLLPSSCLG